MPLLFRAVAILCVAALALALPATAQSVRVEGVVLDSSGASVPGARVELRVGSAYSAVTITDTAGNFIFTNLTAAMVRDDAFADSGSLTVIATGFARVERTWKGADRASSHFNITLAPSSSAEQVIVTAARTATDINDAPSGDVQLSHDDLQATPALQLDDQLRQIPGFSLYRRSSSRTANPTTQGVSLRGLGANGASRALVLEDGVPINDPFGGWVYWDRIPDTSIASIEVVQEGASSLYGSDALGGVVQILTRPASQGGVSLETSYGNQDSPELSLWAGGKSHGWESSFAGQVLHTDGYILVPAADRGSVDTKAGVSDGTADLTIGRTFGAHDDVFARGWYLDESRNNGTPIQTNSTRLAGGSLGADLQSASFGSLALRFFGNAETYHQNFSSVAADRNSETLTDTQAVPAQGVGGSALWSRALGKRQTLVAGFDTHEELGFTHEIKGALADPTSQLSAGGRQRTVGIFGEDLIQLAPKWLLTASARFDDWRNFDASNLNIVLPTPPGAVTLTPYPDRSYNAFSPRLGLVHQVNSHLNLSASAYRAFRAPSLNELYRSFRQGNVLTVANPNLTAERLTGGEAGAALNGWNRRIELRGTFFYNQIVDPVANVTQSTTPALITRMRENLGRTTAPGFEIGAVARVTGGFQLSGGYQYVDTTVSSAPGNLPLVGLWIAQVPHSVLTFQARYSRPSFLNFSVEGRMVGKQFDDDQNQFPLGRFFVLDATASRSLARGVQAFVAVENLLNESYATAATPIPQLGLPIAARFGVRFDWPQR
ncbi:MAG: TonB-dependent receptor [Candidatus Acidiferrales bacterium]